MDSLILNRLVQLVMSAFGSVAPPRIPVTNMKGLDWDNPGGGRLHPGGGI